jgi:hypothetical protein
MYHKAKDFDKDLFDANDPRGRAKAIQILSQYVRVEENPDQYGIDLICYAKEDIKQIFPLYYVEVEVREAWTTTHFPWNTAHIPARKEKFFNDPNLNTFYFQFNNDLTSLLVFDGNVIKKMPIYKGPTKNEKEFYYYEIPYPEGVMKKMWWIK